MTNSKASTNIDSVHTLEPIFASCSMGADDGSGFISYFDAIALAAAIPKTKPKPKGVLIFPRKVASPQVVPARFPKPAEPEAEPKPSRKQPRPSSRVQEPVQPLESLETFSKKHVPEHVEPHPGAPSEPSPKKKPKLLPTPKTKTKPVLPILSEPPMDCEPPEPPMPCEPTNAEDEFETITIELMPTRQNLSKVQIWTPQSLLSQGDF